MTTSVYDDTLIAGLIARIARAEGKPEAVVRVEIGMPPTAHVAAPCSAVPDLPRVPGGGDLLRAVLHALPTADPHGFIAAAAHQQDTAARDAYDTAWNRLWKAIVP